MSDDSRREMQQRALRNVRGLVDRIERDDKADARTQRKILAWVVIGALIATAVLGFLLTRFTGDRGRAVEIPAAQPKPGQLTPQAPRAPQ